MTNSNLHSSVVIGLPSHEQRWALAGLLLSLVILALLVTVMNENAAQAQTTRDLAQQAMQERSRCSAIRDRLARDQCLLDLRLGEQARIAQR